MSANQKMPEKEIQEAKRLEDEWKTATRWEGVRRDHSGKDVVRLRPKIRECHSIAKNGANRLWELLTTKDYVNTFGCLTGAMASQMVKAGLDALYLSGWQVAGDANTSGQTYPDQSLYPVNSVPQVVKRLNNAMIRSDQINRVEGDYSVENPVLPIVADAEAGFGGPVHAFELTTNMISAGAAAVHFEDQLAAEKKCGHMGGKVCVPTSQFIRALKAARLSADVSGVPTLVIARTDSSAASLLTSDIDECDKKFLTGERTAEGYFRVNSSFDVALQRSLAYAPYADLLWMETDTPDLELAKRFADGIHKEFPDQMLAYNCSPSFNWKKHIDDDTIAKFQRELGAMGYKFQFITLAGWHALNYYIFDLARKYRDSGMTAYVELQEAEFAREHDGYTATKHQREVGTGYFDEVLMTITGGEATTAALRGSTEQEQF